MRGAGRRLVARSLAFVAALALLGLPATSLPVPRAEESAACRLPQMERPAVTLDGALARFLEEMGPDERVEVVAQFVGEVTGEDRRLMDELGVGVIREYRALPAVYAVGSKRALLALSQYPRTFWMEHNSRMELLMNGTTTVINATTVWSSRIIERGGYVREPIDGSGVTVALVDTGCDGGHPDLDYGEKVIINLKSDLDQSFTEMQDTDTGSGHGTHCAGTILGNGDASGGARRGVAPGARLVSISTGEHWLQNVVGALEWVYEHSRPGNNPWNIRVCSNSWGAGAGEYDPQDAVSQLAMKLTYENNVVVVFAAGNSGENNHDGHTIETSTYGNTPCVVEVAAALHDGGGLAYFSSRGQSDLNHTWPDLAAPGYRIWATEARGTQITAMVKVSNPSEDAPDAYYMAISGTSMATPHVSGLVALLWQACPSLRVMELHENYNGPEPSWWTDPMTRIHEAEYILEVTSDYMPNESANGVPANNSTSATHFDHPYDFGQGYGLVNASRAVQVALILESMRREDICATAQEAYEAYLRSGGLLVTREVKDPTNTIVTSWKGEWGYLMDNRNTLVTSHARKVFVPQNAARLSIDLNYNPTLGEQRAMGELTVAVDSNGDGGIDWRGQGGWSSSGSKHDDVDASAVGPTGSVWDFYVEGSFIKLPGGQGNPITNQYREILVEYTLGIQAELSSTGGEAPVPLFDLHAAYAQWEPGPYAGGGNASIVMEKIFYDLGRIVAPEKGRPSEAAEGAPPWLAVLAAAVAAGVGLLWYTRKRGIKLRLPFPRKSD
ncbi:MAG: S8 family serine peptidase [Thermoplasmatota archaeon]